MKAVSGLRPRSLSMPVHRAVSLLPREEQAATPCGRSLSVPLVILNTALLSLLHGRFTRYTASTPEASPADVVSLCCRPIASRSIVPARAPSSHSGLFLRQQAHPRPLGMGRVARYRSTASAHLRSTLESVCSGLRPLHGACRSRRCQHHLTGLDSLVRQCRASRHTRTHLPSRPVRPCFRRCGPAASLLCTDTHSIPLLRWLTPLRSYAPHSMPSRFTAHKGQSGGHARAFAPHEVAWLAQWPQYRAPLAVVRGDFPPKAHYRTAYSEKSKRGARSALHRAGGGSSDRKEEKFPLYPFLIADLSACYDFDYWKIVKNCKILLSESMKPSLNFSLLS